MFTKDNQEFKADEYVLRVEGSTELAKARERSLRNVFIIQGLLGGCLDDDGSGISIHGCPQRMSRGSKNRCGLPTFNSLKGLEGFDDEFGMNLQGSHQIPS